MVFMQIPRTQADGMIPVDQFGMVTADKIVRVVEQIIDRIHPVRVVAFGSRARGSHHTASDLDLAVIVDRFIPGVDRRPLWRADLDVCMDMDILLYDVERERLTLDSPLSLQAEVEREGVILFEREAGFLDREAIARLV